MAIQLASPHDSPASFYDELYQRPGYADFADAASHFAYRDVQAFVTRFGLTDQKCLEVGSGRGLFQDLVQDYTGVDLSSSVACHYHKPFLCASAVDLPLHGDSFDAVWSVTMLEHVPDPEAVLGEMRRVLRPGGYLFLKPAWNCRWWNCDGIPVRPYSDLTVLQRYVKFTLPIRNSRFVRGLRIFPTRLARLIAKSRGERPSLRYRKLAANYETFWMVDSDACCSIDPFDVIQWFKAHGDQVISHPNWWSALMSRSESLVVRVTK